jgi:F0F1-type ATP synthase membrane subunit b/b'
MLKDASARIEREMQTARQELQAEMLALVSEATETIIEEKLDKTKDASLIQRALARVRA